MNFQEDYEDLGEIDEFDCKEDFQEEIEGAILPRYAVIDGILYKRRKK